MKCSKHQTKLNPRFCLTFLPSYLLIFFLTPSLAGAYSGGSGTLEDPYQIATVQDLIDLGQTEDDYNKSFVLTADIDLADHVFGRAVIAQDISGIPFSGRFDGRGHVIRNLSIDNHTVDYQGLFGRSGIGAEVTNLGLDGVQVSGRKYVGSLVGLNKGSISSSHSTGAVMGEEHVGGLVGKNSRGHISSSHSTGTIVGEKYVGGLVGKNDSGEISSSYSTGTVSGEDNVGGFVGGNSGREDRVNGTDNIEYAAISSSYSTGVVQGTRTVGGLAGQNYCGTISLSHSTGTVVGEKYVGGLVGQNIIIGTILSSHSTGRVYGTDHVGGLVGGIHRSGSISSSYSSGRVHGSDYVGGLVGSVLESVTISSSYSTSPVSGYERFIGGLVGYIRGSGTISSSYSAGKVFGTQGVGGMVGYVSGWSGTISSSFWDIESSEQTHSEGGIGMTTEQMQDIFTYLEADWDFMDEAANGIEDIWWMPESGTPRLWWQYGYAYSPTPIDNASTGMPDLALQWNSGGQGIQHDLYFGDDEAIVADANTASGDTFLGRLPADILSYDLHSLEPGKTYYWRVDGVNDVDPAQVWKGTVWSFSITDLVTVKVLDDFESYDDYCNRIFFTWQDGWGHSGGENIEGCDVAPYAGNGTGAIVGNTVPPYASHVVIRDASQSLPMYYDNSTWPWFSETERSWPVAQDWTIDDTDALTLYFRGDGENYQDLLYIAVEDSHGGIAVVYHLSESAVLSTEAQVWHISLADLDALGVNTSAIRKLVIGVGNRDNPQPAGTGTLYIDDIELTKRAP